MAVAIEWVSRITSVGLMMVLPGIGGMWLDRRLETRFLGPLGFALGMSAGIWQLIVITRPQPGANRSRNSSRPPDPGGSSDDKDRSL